MKIAAKMSGIYTQNKEFFWEFSLLYYYNVI